jgi:hypothetical protein
MTTRPTAKIAAAASKNDSIRRARSGMRLSFASQLHGDSSIPQNTKSPPHFCGGPFV